MKVLGELVGATLSNRYRLVARLAGGGMGEVYRGHDLLLDRKVAVKILQPNLAADPELVARFKAEARAAARLSHPNVVAVHDWGAEDERTYYMVMEYVSGRDLRDILIARERLDQGQAAEIVAQVCDALAAAHDIGLVHRDVKPENVIISRDGRAKVVDFGIAVVHGKDLTAPGGAIPGTLRYLSPEQAAGAEASPASDLWAAGVVLYELLVGTPPPQGSGLDLIRRRAVEPIGGPRDFDEAIADGMDRVVRTASALDPAARFSDARAMGDAVRRAQLEVREPEALTSLLEEDTGEIRLPDMEPTAFTRVRGPRSRNAWRRRLLPVAVALLFLVAGVKALAGLAAPNEVRVPSVIGMSLARAEGRLEERGLASEVLDHRADIGIPKGQVIAQRPASGILLEGDGVGLILSSGPPRVKVSSVIGDTLEVATVRLRVHGMRVGDVSDRFDPAPEGTVIAQDPSERARWGSAVDLVISKGPESIGVPDVVGMSFAKAKDTLEAAGFEVTRENAYSNDVAKGKVISSNPPPDSTAPDGSAVNLVVSVGPEFKELEMPDVRGMSVDQATSVLENMGVVDIRVVQSCGGGGTIVNESDPIAGRPFFENDPVALFVC